MRTIPVAASSALADLLTGPVRAAEVLASGHRAAYLHVGGRVLAVVSDRAVAPASSVLLPRGHDPQHLLPSGARVDVGHGVLTAAGGCLRVARWFAPAGPTSGGVPDPRSLRTARDLLSCRVVEPQVREVRRLGDVAGRRLVGLAEGDPAQVLDSILGRGPGLTPSGDDVTAGLLLAARAVFPDPTRVDRLSRQVLGLAITATTVVSRGMLADAAAGMCPVVVAAGLDALLRPYCPQSTPQALRELGAVGHTSGSDLLAGALSVLEHVSSATCPVGPPVSPRARTR